MSSITVMTVFGTRPEAIKMAPLHRALAQNENITALCAVTAQHRDMLDSVLKNFDLQPDYDLNIMQPGQNLSGITTKTLEGMDALLETVRPDLILVHGDTTTTFSAALSAFYHKISVGHVEAGLRTYNKMAPYPEEINRNLVTRIADLHFCPTIGNAENLQREGIERGVFVTGNTVIDALGITVRPDYRFQTPELQGLPFGRERVVLVTAHRRENFGEGLYNIFWALRDLMERFPDVHFVLPVHPNPLVTQPVQDILGGHARMHLLPPLPVLDMHNLISRCHLVLTDSGGLQEEAPAFGKPVLVLREETERPEAITAGTVMLGGVRRADIVDKGDRLLSDTELYHRMATAVNPYGDGQASRRIVEAILWHFGLQTEKPDAFCVK